MKQILEVCLTVVKERMKNDTVLVHTVEKYRVLLNDRDGASGLRSIAACLQFRMCRKCITVVEETMTVLPRYTLFFKKKYYFTEFLSIIKSIIVKDG